jgi:hypothetical protein
MNQPSRRLEQAFDTARQLSADQQDMLALELLDRATSLTAPATKLSVQERMELEAELDAARRGEFADDDTVRAMYAKYGL